MEMKFESLIEFYQKHGIVTGLRREFEKELRRVYEHMKIHRKALERYLPGGNEYGIECL